MAKNKLISINKDAFELAENFIFEILLIIFLLFITMLALNLFKIFLYKHFLVLIIAL